jgi:transposase
MPKKQAVTLTRQEVEMLLAIVRTGTHKARTILHAYVLLKSAAGWTDEAIADAFSTSPDTVRRIRLRAISEGILAALEERPRSGQPGKRTDEQEALLIALACSTPPAGRAHWTAALLKAEAQQRHFVGDLSDEAVRLVLQKTRSSRGRSRVGVTLTSMRRSWAA